MAAYALERLGPGAQPALAALITATRDSVGGTRLAAVAALDSLGPGAIAAASALVERLADRSEIADAAERALSQMVLEATPDLLQMASEGESRARTRAVRLLGRAESQDSSTVTALIEGLASNADVAQASANALQRLDTLAIPIVIDAVRSSESTQFITRAITVLDSIGISDPSVVSLLVDLLREPTMVANAAEVVLRKTGAASVNELLRVGGEAQGTQAQRIARLLVGLGPPEEALPVLARFLSDRTASGWAIAGLVQGGARSVPLVLRVLNDVEDPDAYQVGAAAVVIDSLGSVAAAAAPALVRMLDGFRGEVAPALAKLGTLAVPALSEGTESSAARVRQRSAELLGPLRAPEAIPALTALLDDRRAATAAREALVNIGADSRELVLGGLRGATPTAEILTALEQLGIDVTSEVIVAMDDPRPEVRRNAALALGSMTTLPASAHVRLVRALGDPDDSVGSAALESILRLGTSFEPALDTVAVGSDPVARRRAVMALWKLGARSDPSRAALMSAVADQDARVRRIAALALAVIEGPEEFGDGLMETLSDESGEARQTSAELLSDLAVGYQDGGRIDRLPLVRAIEEALAESSDQNVFSHAEEVRRAKEALNSLWFGAKWEELKNWAIEHRVQVGVVLAYLGLLGASLFLLLVQPLWLFAVSEKLARLPSVNLPKWLGAVEFSAGTLLTVGLFRYHPRVLDAWVAKRAPQVTTRFQEIATVREREIHVPAPIELDGEVFPTPQVHQLRPLFSQRRNVVLITGEGGAGKTSLACALGRLAARESQEERLNPKHLMLPILVEHDLNRGGPGGRPLLDAVTSQLTAALDEESSLPEGLVRVLLRKGRLLVIVDHFSEMNEDTRKLIRLDDAEVEINALIITSRRDEPLQGLPHRTVRPLRIKGERLSSFMEAYLLQRGAREEFEDSEYFEYCQRLSEMVGDRDATVLLVKLYAEQMIAVKSGSIGSTPETIPKLILSYLNELNLNARPEDPTDREVQKAAATVAWECVRETFRPLGGKIDTVTAALGGDAESEAILRYLEESLKLVAISGVERDSVRFALDPVAEYLAAISITRECASDRQAWKSLVARIDEADGSPDSISGFLRALYDCVNGGLEDDAPPEAVIEEIAVRAGLDPDARRRAADAQRVRMLIRQLHRDHEADKIVAAAFLGNMGEGAADALPILRRLQESEGDQLQTAVAQAIDKIANGS